jgi:hypothetical protein
LNWRRCGAEDGDTYVRGASRECDYVNFGEKVVAENEQWLCNYMDLKICGRELSWRHKSMNLKALMSTDTSI